MPANVALDHMVATRLLRSLVVDTRKRDVTFDSIDMDFRQAERVTRYEQINPQAKDTREG